MGHAVASHRRPSGLSFCGVFAASVCALAALACNADLPAAASGGGAGGTGAAGTAVAGAGATVDAGPPSLAGTGGSAAAGSGGADAGPAAVCRLSDNPEWDPDDADGGVDPSCTMIPRKIIAENCIGSSCHHNGKFQQPAGALDLMSPCIADRMVGTVSRCEGMLLIDPAQPDSSFLLNKLEREKPTCGESMPFTGHLTPAEQRCMNAWVHAISREANSTP